MRGPDAPRVVAAVANLFARLYWSVRDHVGDAVRAFLLSVDLEPAVWVAAVPLAEYPTAILGRFIHEGPEHGLGFAKRPRRRVSFLCGHNWVVYGFLLTCLPGCAGLTAVAPPGKQECPAPPAAALEPTQVPRFQGRTNGDLLNYILELRIAVKECNLNIDAIRRWADAPK